MNSTTSRIAHWLAGEDVFRSRRALVLASGIAVVSLGYGIHRGREVTRPLRTAGAQPALPADNGDERFGVPLAQRREIFAQFAAQEPKARAEGERSFPGPDLAWSAEDHRGAFERKTAAALSARYRLTLTQVYLILDEGIRERWPGPDGQPLRATTVPLHPRRNYGW